MIHSTLTASPLSFTQFSARWCHFHALLITLTSYQCCSPLMPPALPLPSPLTFVGKLMMLPSDLVLIEDAQFKPYVDAYAKDQKKFFGNAWTVQTVMYYLFSNTPTYPFTESEIHPLHTLTYILPILWNTHSYTFSHIITSINPPIL